MPCYRPLKAFRTSGGVVFTELKRDDHLGDIEIPCGQCIGCRLRRAQDWTLRVQHEASAWEANCFVTLTYARDRLPPMGSLEHRDFQLFMKRIRKATKQKIRYYMCGEYGPKNLRPHYHACLFNIDFRADRIATEKSSSGYLMYESNQLTELWGHGKATVQDLVKQTAGYCARYIMKKQLGQAAETAYEYLDQETGEIRQKKPEYAAMSLKPGIGATWFKKYQRDVFPHDFVVSEGVKHQVPKYYDKLIKRAKLQELDDIELARYRRAQDASADNTDQRRRDRETVQLAKVVNLKREME